MKISSTRKEYKNSKSIFDRGRNPLKKFKAWYKEAEQKVSEPNAFTLSTSYKNKPSSRIMLLKELDNELIFFTNKISRKGKDISSNKYASMVFWWKEINKQVRIEGKLRELPKEDVIKYFYSRPRESQIGALASIQSSKLDSYNDLISKFEEIQNQYLATNKKIPMPKSWVGYILDPELIEFWQGGSHRLHQRLEFKRNRNRWIKSVLSP
jgi:pyridoxamine 5'-phosphate oxidase